MNQREAAQARFQLLKDAYDVLMNENLRALYDDFGAEAVKKQMSMQVGKPVQSNADFLREMFRMRRQQHQAYIMRRVDHTGSFMVLVNAMNNRGETRPEMGTISLRQSVKFPLSANSNVRLTFAALLSGASGTGSVKMAYHRSFVAAAAAGYASLRLGYGAWTARFGASKQLSERTYGDLNFGFDNGTGRLRLRCVRQLNSRWNGSLESSISRVAPSVKIGIATRPDNPHWQFSTDLEAGSTATGINARGSYEWSERTTIALEAGIANSAQMVNNARNARALHLLNSWHFAGHAERTISQLTKAHVGFTIAPHGVFVTSGFTRHGQTFSIPLMLTHVPTFRAGTLAVFAPLIIAFFIEAIMLEPRRRRKRVIQEEKRRKQQEVQVAAAKARAMADCRLMTDEVTRKREAEEAKGGLVILQAFYGRHPDSSGEMPIDAPEDDVLADRVEVSLPLQYMVQNSQLQVPSGTTKSALIGFYDPVPDEDKWIEVVYLYRHKTHRIVASDFESLRMPLKSHQMD